MVRKLRCITPSGDLIKDEIYTIHHIDIKNGKEYYSVNEICNGKNSFYDWRFKKIIPELNKYVNVL